MDIPLRVQFPLRACVSLHCVDIPYVELACSVPTACGTAEVFHCVRENAFSAAVSSSSCDWERLVGGTKPELAIGKLQTTSRELREASAAGDFFRRRFGLRKSRSFRQVFRVLVEGYCGRRRCYTVMCVRISALHS